MKPEEARFILAAVRPSSDAAAPPPSALEDPNVAEAIRVMENDADLKAWYAEHCRFDQAVATRIGSIEPPPDLKSNILAGLKVSGPVPWWQRGSFRVLAVAAGVMLIAAVTHMARQNPAPGTGSEQIAAITGDFRRTVVGEIENLRNFDHMSDRSSELVAWLDQQGAPTLASLDLPSRLGNAEVAGCKMLDWQGHRVSLMCFLAPDQAGTQHSFHLVVADREALPDLTEDQPLFTSEDGWSTAVWRQGSKVVMLATNNPDPSELRRHRQQIALTKLSHKTRQSLFFGNKPPPPLLLPMKHGAAA